MTAKDLEIKWTKIKAPKSSFYSYQRIDNKSIPNLQVGITSKLNRCVILKLDSKLNFEFKEIDKINLITFYDKSENNLVLELKDPFFNDLFTDLVISLYEIIKKIPNEDESTRLFINTIRYWSEFLKSKRSELLSDEVITGIYGELVYLEYLIDNMKDPINKILGSWKGLYDTTHDFHFSNKNVEIKTKNQKSNIINIASEFQLEPELGKELELIVISVAKIDHGDTLKKILDRIRKKTLNEGGSIDIIIDAIANKNMNFSNVSVYNYLKFKPKKIETYNCNSSKFPGLIKSKIDKSIKGVKYKLDLSSIDKDLKIKTEILK